MPLANVAYAALRASLPGPLNILRKINTATTAGLPNNKYLPNGWQILNTLLNFERIMTPDTPEDLTTPEQPNAPSDPVHMELGGNITLVGFKELESGELIVVKKVVGSYARKMADSSASFENLTVTLKTVHHTPKSEKYEIHARYLDNGHLYTGEAIERNLFMALDECLRRTLETKQHKEKGSYDEKTHHA